MKTKNEDELKPCPFCGSSVFMQYMGSSDWSFDCQNKNCSICASFFVNARTHGYGEGEKKEAIRRWNTRVPAETVDVEKLKRKVEVPLAKSFDITYIFDKGWNECIDHLAENGYLRTPQACLSKNDKSDKQNDLSAQNDKQKTAALEAWDKAWELVKEHTPNVDELHLVLGGYFGDVRNYLEGKSDE